MDFKILDILHKLVTHAQLADPSEKEGMLKVIEEAKGVAPDKPVAPPTPPTYEELLAKYNAEVTPKNAEPLTNG